MWLLNNTTYRLELFPGGPLASLDSVRFCLAISRR
jgi:hypothetical protein